ncbi:hypothetical protein SB00610_01296 [Klebsiella quasipneumoniae subsp. similipneumoniae]|nr:hypothetical protein SB00610_01296 [Klebsiella quasipneumoniae subsp. similipneumoniae]
MLRHVLPQFANGLRIERFVAGHGQVIFRRQPGRRRIAIEHAAPGRQRAGDIAAARLLASQTELALRHLRHFFGVVQILQSRVVRRRFRQPRAPLRRRLHIAALLRPERHQIQRLGVVGIHREHLLQGLHRQLVMGFLMPVVGLGEQRLQRRVVTRRQRAARSAESQGAGEAECGEPPGAFHRYRYLSFHWLSPEPRRLRA